MKSMLSAVLIVVGLGTTAAIAAEECKIRSCATTTVAATPTGWNLKLSVRQGPGNEADWFNLRVLGHPQLELNTPSGEMNLGIPTGWDGTFALQGCESSFGNGSFCDSWSNFKVELPIASDDRNFCVRYAGHATSEATSAQQMSCNFSTPPGRWSTDNAFHLNWCLDQIRNAGGNPGMLVGARQLADSEDRARIDSIKACQSAVAAATPPSCPAGQTFSESENQCVIPPPPGAGGSLQMSCKSGPGMKGVKEARGLLVSFAAPSDPNAGTPGPGECIIAERPLLPNEPRQLLVPPVESSNARLLAEAVNGGSFQLHVTTRDDAFRVTSIDGVQVMGGMLGGAPADPTPAPVPGGGLTASTCGLSGTATVVIADPALTTLNVRDRPNGETILTKLPENTQVNVVGACGSSLGAGIVAQQVTPGWCAISAPLTGCVKEEFLVAGAPAQGGGLPAGSAGIVANPPAQQQQQPQPQTPPPVVTTAPAGGGQMAQLTQGANVRNEPSGNATDKNGNKNVLGSLPGGTTVTVLDCNKSWCRITHPQFPSGWVSRKFVQMTGVAVTVQITTPPPVVVAPEQAPAPAAPQDGGGLTASTCSLSGTATIIIADPKLTTLNVRDRPNGETILTKLPENSQVNVVGACGKQLSAGIVAGPIGTLVPGWCAISAPLTGCVKEEFLVAGIPAAAPAGAGSAGLVATKPSFTGTWAAEAQGSTYTFTLNQNGNAVSGNYTGSDGSNGQLSGNVSGNVLRFAWQQTDGLQGAGKFTMSDDGGSFDGSYTLGNNPDVADGSWNGRRQ